MRLVCEWHGEHDCGREVVAKIGLPSKTAIWVCERAFQLWRETREK